jgi:hypothetical protein
MASSTITYYPSEAFWQTARKINGSGLKAYPLDGSPAHFTLEDRLAIKPASYSRLSLDTAHAVETSAYLVDEQPLSRSPAFTYFRRLYSTIPASHVEPGSDAWSFPGFSQSVALGTQKTITAYNFSTRVFTSAGHGFSDGAIVRVFIKTTQGGIIWTQSATGTIDNPTTDTFEIDGIYPSGTSFASGTAQTISPARDSVTLPADARTIFDYFLPGVSSGITTVEDIPKVSAFGIVTSTGQITDTLSETSVPTLAQYQALVTGAEFIPIECFIERYLGNIYRRVTRYVRAT